MAKAGLEDLPKIMNQIGKGVEFGVRKSVKDMTRIGGKEYGRNIIKSKNIAVNVGLVNSIIADTDDGWKSGEFGSDLAYSIYVEFGSRPHKVPFGRLFDWTAIKILKVSPNSTDPEVRGAIFALTTAIQKSIMEKGTRAYPNLRNAGIEVEKQANSILAKNISKGVDRFVK